MIDSWHNEAKKTKFMYQGITLYEENKHDYLKIK